MKVYFDAGLKELAVASGFRAETLSSLVKASNFKRTHSFLMQVWEVLYHHFFETFMRQHPGDTSSSEDMLLRVKDTLLLCSKKCKENQSFETYVRYTQSMRSDYEHMFQNFQCFLVTQCDAYKIWAFCLFFKMHWHT